MRTFIMICMAASTAALQSAVCETSITVSTAHVGQAFSLVLKATETCNNGTGSACDTEVAAAATAVIAAQKSANTTVKECGPATTTCGKDVATAQTALDKVTPLMAKAQADCGKSAVECNTALLATGTQLTRSAVAFNQAGKDCKTTVKGSPECEELIVVALGDLSMAGDYLQEAIVACNNGSSAQCAADISGVVANVADASNAVSKAVTACGGAGTACAQDITGAAAALATTSQKLAQATSDCSGSGHTGQCIVDLLDVSDDLGHAVQDIILATTDCQSNSTNIGTPVCEAEVVLVVTRVGDAARAVIAASKACNNGTNAECQAAVATASSTVGAANADSKRAVNECGDPTARCGRHVAISTDALEIAVILMSNATTTCGRTGVDRVHCRIDLLMVETELARADVFAVEAATMCAGSQAYDVDSRVCEAEVVLVLTRINDAARDLAAASTTCNNGTNDECKTAVAAASTSVNSANTDIGRAVNECGDPTARCGRHVAIAAESLAIAVALMDNATTTCGRTGIDKVHCRIDLLMVDTEVARAAAFDAEAATMCGGNDNVKSLGTPVCEAEVVLVVTRIGSAAGDLRAATKACTNGTNAECQQGVAAASTSVNSARTDSKRAVNECGDPQARCGKNVAVADGSLEVAIALMDNATTVCGRTGVDRVHCQIDLLMVDTEVARAAVFSAEAATMCAGKAAIMGGACQTSVTLGLARVGTAMESVLKASEKCTNGTDAECKTAASSAMASVDGAGKTVNITAKECPKTAPCGTDITTAQSALEAAQAPIAAAAAKCGTTGDKIACRTDLLQTSTDLTKAALGLNHANTDCKNATQTM